jgi:hypothetical protein
MAMLDTAEFREPGLYLLWPDGSRIELTRCAVEEAARAMLDDPARIPPRVRAASEYQPCDICPHRETAVICSAIMPALPYVEEIDRYLSYDAVTAVSRGARDGHLRVAETTMQQALQFVSILSLTSWCEVGRKYGALFEGIDPLTPAEEIAVTMLQRLHLEHRGDLAAVSAVAGVMQEELLHTTRCQLARLRLISWGDALPNAFVAAHATAELLFLELRRLLRAQAGDPSTCAAAPTG